MHKIGRTISILLGALLTFTLTPTASAFSGKIQLDNDHTDAFYVITEAERPVVKVANGSMDPQYYNPDNTEFLISDTTFFSDYPFSQLGSDGKIGYYTSNWNFPGYFEPGWSAPQFKEHGYSEIGINFQSVTGPGRIALFGNDELQIETDDNYYPLYISPFLKGGAFFVENGTTLPIYGHQHAHWLFTKSGTYTLTGQAVGIKNGETLTSDTFTVTFTVAKNEAEDTAYAEASETPDDPDTSSEGDKDQPPEDTTKPNDPHEDTKPGKKLDETLGAGEEEATSEGKPHESENTDTSPTTDDATPVELDHGHIDLLNALIRDGKLVLNTKDDTKGAPVLRDPNAVTLRIHDLALTEIPRNLHHILPTRGYFLGENGTKQTEVPFPGWDTSLVPESYGPVEFEFLQVQGAGKVFLFHPTKPVLTSQQYELTSGSSIIQQLPGHVHANWLFEKPGIYTMQVRAKAGELVSNTATYTWFVGTKTKSSSNPARQPSKDDTSTPVKPNNSNIASISTPIYHTNSNLFTGKSLPLTQKCKTNDWILLPGLKDGRTSPAQWVDPKSAPFAIGDAGKTKASQNIGAITAGSPVWMISSSQIPNVPWLGVNTQESNTLAHTHGAVTFALTSFSGPGHMEVFLSGNFGNTVEERWFAGSGSHASGKTLIQPNTHAHPNWVFDQPGTYSAGITMTAQLNNGKTLSGTTTLTFKVGSGTGATDGHFDLGPKLEKCGTTTSLPPASNVSNTASDTGKLPDSAAIDGVPPSKALASKAVTPLSKMHKAGDGVDSASIPWLTILLSVGIFLSLTSNAALWSRLKTASKTGGI